MKSKRLIRLPAGLLLAGTALLLCSDAFAQRAGQSMSVQTGVVVAARSVDLQSEAGRGAVVGGVAGAAGAALSSCPAGAALTSSNRSSSRRVRNTLIGAGTGAAISNRAQGSRNGMQYTVQTAPGSTITVVTDQTEVRVGDCVNVEQAGNGMANVRRVSQSLCELSANDSVDEEIASYMEQEADRCAQAKDQMLDAETDEAFELALRRVDFFCDD